MAGTLDHERFRKLLYSLPSKAIEILYEHYYRSLIGIARSLTHDDNAAEDIVQETFVHVWEHHRRLGQPHDQSIEHYLVRVVRNKSVTHYKRVRHLHEQKIKFLYGQHVHVNDVPMEARLIRSETSQEIRAIILTFPRRERECLFLKLDEDLTVDQIAVRLAVSRKAVERSITSANKRLRRFWLSK